MKMLAKGFKWLLVTAVLAANLAIGVRLYSQEVAAAGSKARPGAFDGGKDGLKTTKKRKGSCCHYCSIQSREKSLMLLNR